MRRRYVWLAISLYLALLVFSWLDYLMGLTGYATLGGALLYTVIAPLVTFAGFKIHRMKSLKFWQVTWAIFGAVVLGFIIYGVVNLLLYRILSLPAWVKMNGDIRLVLTMPISYVVGAYLGYRLGKSRAFTPPLFG